MFRGGFAWPNAVQNTSGERQWKLKKIESIPEYWSEMSLRSPGKKESLDSLTTREISLTRSCRNLSALIKWEISPVYWNHLKPLSPNSDQHRLSPNNIHTLSRDKLWELIKWSPKRECHDLLSNSLNSFFKEIYRDQFGEFVCGYWGFKG